MKYDPSLRVANGSAAECGNSGLARIRKTLSYMNEEHAILFTQVCFDTRPSLQWRLMISAA